MFHISRFGLTERAQSYQSMAHSEFCMSHLKCYARPEFLVEVGRKCRAGAMVIELQVAYAIPKTAEGRYGVLGVRNLAMTPQSDLEAPVVWWITLALTASTRAPGYISLTGRCSKIER
jgi:hypothetical protein